MASETGTASHMHTCKRAQSIFFAPLLQVFTSSKHLTKKRWRLKAFWVLICKDKAYEFKQSTTIFFHRFLVPTIVMMHFFLGLKWRTLWSSSKKTPRYQQTDNFWPCKMLFYVHIKTQIIVPIFETVEPTHTHIFDASFSRNLEKKTQHLSCLCFKAACQRPEQTRQRRFDMTQSFPGFTAARDEYSCLLNHQPRCWNTHTHLCWKTGHVDVLALYAGCHRNTISASR